jgi:PIN domain nuclease of toxin-antitoxin system
MRLLLDTHSFLWFITGDDRLSKTARGLVEDLGNQPWLSLASLWEIAIKTSIGRLELARPFGELIPEQMNLNGIEALDIRVEHLAQVAQLPFHHRDPFDRLLIAQAKVEDMPIVGADEVFDIYSITRLW